MAAVEYDAEADALYIWLGKRQAVAETIEVDQSRLVDLDDAGQVIGVEVLGASNYALADIAGRFGFGERLAELDASVDRALASTTGRA